MTGKPALCLLLLVCLVQVICGQESGLYQNLGGKVSDAYTHLPLAGATVSVAGTNPLLGTVTDQKGNFFIKHLPIGRLELDIRYLGYSPFHASNLILLSGRELFVQVELDEAITNSDEVQVKASLKKDRAINDMATVSARSFSTEETYRYAGSLGDPARMAANYAGVMAETPQNNDIIIRGNSPIGLLWRLDGIDIPNPNHFGSLGATGGPVTMLNTNLLTNSDFYTSAFPAEYGNALSGVFDLRMREGNAFKRQYWAELGWNGMELGAEGYFSPKSTASYLISGRYSFLDLLGQMNLIGYQPVYSDLSLKIEMPVGNRSKFALIGMAGTSHINIDDSKKDTSDWTYKESGVNNYFSTSLAVLGFSYLFYPGPKSSVLLILSISNTRQISKDDTFTIAARNPFTQYQLNDKESQLNLSVEHNWRPMSGIHFSSGFSIREYQLSYVDSTFENGQYKTLTNIQKSLPFFQAFSQFKKIWQSDLAFTIGLHTQFLPFNRSFDLEPRAGIRWEFLPNQSLSLGYGLESQMQPRMIYFYRTMLPDGESLLTNKTLGFSKSHQFVLGYDYVFSNSFRIKAEIYYQYLFNIPVQDGSIPQFSLINDGDIFGITPKDSLINKGTGTNKGIELTVEKFLFNGYYWLITTSLYDSRYKGYDGIERNTAFNGNYILNFLGGKEFRINEKNSLGFDVKFMTAGGKRYIPILIAESMKEKETIYDWQHAYEKQFNPFLMVDLRISYTMNHKKTTNKFSLDFQNLSNHKNILLQKFDPTTGKISNEFQIGFFPMIYWRMDW
jgi:CarboxypepD_reg-like domain